MEMEDIFLMKVQTVYLHCQEFSVGFSAFQSSYYFVNSRLCKLPKGSQNE